MLRFSFPLIRRLEYSTRMSRILICTTRSCLKAHFGLFETLKFLNVSINSFVSQLKHKTFFVNIVQKCENRRDIWCNTISLAVKPAFKITGSLNCVIEVENKTQQRAIVPTTDKTAVNSTKNNGKHYQKISLHIVDICIRVWALKRECSIVGRQQRVS